MDNKDEVIANLEGIKSSLYSVDELGRDLEAVCSQIAVSKEMYTKALNDRPITDSTQLSSVQDIYIKALVDKIVVYSKEDVRVSFKDGREVR